MVQKYYKSLLQKGFWLKWMLPFLVAIIIFGLSFSPMWIEKWYSTGLYLFIGRCLRLLFGWLGFSIGDVFYILFFIYVLFFLIRWIRLIWSYKNRRTVIASFFAKLILCCLWFYIGFNILWGLNYNRAGIAEQLHLEKNNYCKEDVVALTDTLIKKVNFYRSQIKDTSLPEMKVNDVFKQAEENYRNVVNQFAFLNYQTPSVKKSLFSSLGNYFGFTGYYNPFSGEAQVRSDIPTILLPYITYHEMAHQLGYASESEANFVGYLSATATNNNYFLYSVYLDLFSYAQSEEIRKFLEDADAKGLIAQLKQNRNNLDTLVKKDRKQIREFFFKRQNKISPLVSNIYDQYLKFNHQFAGIQSYDEVIGWLLAYQRKYHKL